MSISRAASAMLLLAHVVLAGALSPAAAQQAPETAETLKSALESDPRLADLSPENRLIAVEEAVSWGLHCERNVTLVNAYQCACFAGRMLGYRLEDGFEPTGVGRGHLPRTDLNAHLIKDGNAMPECLAPEKLTRYAESQADFLASSLVRGETIDASQLKRVKDCVVRRYVEYETKRAATTLLRNLGGDPLSEIVTACATGGQTTHGPWPWQGGSTIALEPDAKVKR